MRLIALAHFPPMHTKTRMNRKGMETQRVENRDGSQEAVISRVEPFAIDKTVVTIDMFRKFVKDTG